MKVTLISEKEIKLTKEVVEIMEWSERKIEGVSVPILYSDFIPIVIGKKYLTLHESNDKKDQDKIMLFRPLLSGKAVQFVVDYLFDNEENCRELIIKKDEEKKRYSGYILFDDGEKLELRNYIRETQLKFALFYKFYNDVDIKHDIIEINKFNNEQKSLMDKEEYNKKRNRK